MSSQSATKSLILAFAERSRHHLNKADYFRKEIEPLLLKLYPSLDGKVEDGTADWSCDIMNAENDAEVEATLQRIHQIETRRNKELKIRVLSDRLNVLEHEVSQVETELRKLERE